MKNIILYTTLLVTILISTISPKPAHASSRPSRQQLATEQQAEQSIAQDMFVKIRVYLDWVNKPREYQLVSVPLHQLSIRKNDIGHSFGRDPGRAAIIVTADDQENPIVECLLEGFVYLYFYDTASKEIAIWPQNHRRWKFINDQNNYKTWTFEDVDGNILSNKDVDICIASENFYNYNYSNPIIWVKTVKTDSNGQLELPLLLAPTQILHGFVHHPDCGVVRAEDRTKKKEQTTRRMVAPARSKDKWCVFADELGNPIPNAKVEIRFGHEWVDTNRFSPSEHVTLDDRGRLKPPMWDPRISASHFLFEHHDYGRVLVEPLRAQYNTKFGTSICTVPLVKKGDKADRRSIWGTIVDPNNEPMPKVIIKVMAATNAHNEMIRTITDPNGRFCLYPPQKTTYSHNPSFNPLGCRYYAIIVPPKNSGLSEMKTHIESGQASNITLEPLKEKPEPKPEEIKDSYFHRLAFEDQNGLITDTEILSNISISVFGTTSSANPTGTREWKYDQWKNTGQFPIGIYRVQNRSTKRIVFDSLRVEPNSPELLVFQPTPDVVYQGAVIDGATGQPLQDVIVAATGVPQKTDLRLSTEEWEMLYDRIKNPSETIDYESEKKLPFYVGQFTTVTDKSGHYYLSIKPGQINKNPPLFFLKKDYIPLLKWRHFDTSNRITRAECNTNRLNTNDSSEQNLNTTILFPGAYIIFEPSLSDKKVQLTFEWELEGQYSTSLRRHLMEMKSNSLFPHPTQRFGSDKVYALLIPAEQTITIRIHEQRQNQWLPYVKTGIKLKQGEELDIGKITFERAVPVTLQIIHGLTATVTGTKTHETTVPADLNGIAKFAIAPNDKGQFKVRLAPYANSPEIVESMDFQVGDEITAGKHFEMKLSDKIIRQTISRR